MKPSRLIFRSLLYYWRTNLPVVAGIAVAVAVMSGALMVGRSVRGSLRDLLFQRIGNTETVVTAADHFFRTELSEAFSSDRSDSCPILYMQGILIRDRLDEGQSSRMRVHRVNVYGIDESFWHFQGFDMNPFSSNGSAFVGSPLAGRLGIKEGDTLLLQIETNRTIPREWLYGRREDVGKTVRLSCERILSSGKLGEFSLRPYQGETYTIFVPMERLQKDLQLHSSANTILISGLANHEAFEILRRSIRLEDLGLKLKPLQSYKGFSLETDRIVLEDSVAQEAIKAAQEKGLEISPVYTYMANAIRAKGRTIPYSAITAADLGKGVFRNVHILPSPPEKHEKNSLPPIFLNDWARNDLNVSVGDEIEVEYYLWQEAGSLETRRTSFYLAGTVPISGDINASLSPEIPGVTDAGSISSWNPPFPLDLKLIRDKDEKYWDRYRATPKAFVPLAVGQRLWNSRFGTLTSIRFGPSGSEDPGTAENLFAAAFLGGIRPESVGYSIHPVKESGIQASHGSTDFGEYFIYFSFFLIVSALLLSSLFFRLTIEQRVRELGLLKVSGFRSADLRNLYLKEGFLLAFAGGLSGVLLSLLYGWLMVLGLRTLWIDAVGTSHLVLHFSWTDLAYGAVMGICVSLGTVVWTIHGLRRSTPRALLSGVAEIPSIRQKRTRIVGFTALISAVSAILLILSAVTETVSQVVGFFVAGFLLLVSLLCGIAFFLRRVRPRTITGSGWLPLLRLGVRNATHRPVRSLLCAALIASATFIIVSTEAFHRDPAEISLQKHSGSGGYPFLAESTLPVLYDMNSEEGREAMAIRMPENADSQSLHFVHFRERQGDDTSCLNLYTPQDPKILGAPASFLRTGRFGFAKSTAQTAEQQENPWLLLETSFPDGAVPAIADASTIQYILHLSVGDDFKIRADDGSMVPLRLVAGLKDSIFQGGLLISEENFLKLFPAREGYSFFLIDMPQAVGTAALQPLRESLGYRGVSIMSTQELLSRYHSVENTFLSTFQFLGTLGLILGTFGLAAVLLRNVLERRSELALLRAAGYRRRILSGIVLCENILLLSLGVGSGILCALLAIVPALLSRGELVPLRFVWTVLVPVFLSGVAASLVAVIAVFRSPLLPALRSE